MENDNELIMLYYDNNEIAEKLLVEKYKKIICIIICKYGNVIYKLDIDVKELYCQCVRKIYKALKNYDTKNEAKFNTYMTAIITRTINKAITKAVQEKSEVCLDKCLLISYEADPLYKMIREEDEERIERSIIDTLNERELLVYSYTIQGYNYREIADKTKINYSSIIRIKNNMKNKIKLVLELN